MRESADLIPVKPVLALELSSEQELADFVPVNCASELAEAGFEPVYSDFVPGPVGWELRPPGLVFEPVEDSAEVL